MFEYIASNGSPLIDQTVLLPPNEINDLKRLGSVLDKMFENVDWSY